MPQDDTQTTTLATLRVINPSFEADRYGTAPGLAARNGGTLTGWTFSGSVGVNPHWQDTRTPAGPAKPFADNGKTPHGSHVLFMQNEAVVRQTVPGFRSGHRYQVLYWENGRDAQISAEAQILEVKLGGITVVSPHEVPPIERSQHYTMPYARVESAIFIPERDGAHEVLFQTHRGGGTSVLIDHVRLVDLGV